MMTSFFQVVKEEVVESCIIDDPDMEIQVIIIISLMIPTSGTPKFFEKFKFPPRNIQG